MLWLESGDGFMLLQQSGDWDASFLLSEDRDASLERLLGW
jgi:hypothetical protein